MDLIWAPKFASQGLLLPDFPRYKTWSFVDACQRGQGWNDFDDSITYVDIRKK